MFEITKKNIIRHLDNYPFSVNLVRSRLKSTLIIKILYLTLEKGKPKWILELRCLRIM